MNIIKGLKRHVLARIPGMCELRSKMRVRRKKLRYARKFHVRLDSLEEMLLPDLTARFLQKLAPYESAGILLIRVGNEADGGYVMGIAGGGGGGGMHLTELMQPILSESQMM